MEALLWEIDDYNKNKKIYYIDDYNKKKIIIKGSYTVTMVTALRKLRIGVFNVLCETAGALATTTGTAMNARN